MSLSPHRSQSCANESCIAQVIRTTGIRPGYVHPLVGMMVPVQLDKAMVIITQESLA